MEIRALVLELLHPKTDRRNSLNSGRDAKSDYKQFKTEAE